MRTTVKLFIAALFINCLTTAFTAAKTNSEENVFDVLQKDKKPPKPKEEFDWEKLRPKKLSGNKDIDNYILKCDTVWERLQTYHKSIFFFKLDTLKDVEKGIRYVVIVDEQGNEKGFLNTFSQNLILLSSSVGILADATTITAMNVSAGTSLVSNPLLAFGYSKCLSGGTAIIKMTYDIAKDVIERKKEENNELKKLKASRQEGSTDLINIIPDDENWIPSPDKIRELSEADLAQATNLEGLDEDFDDAKLEELLKKAEGKK